MRMRLPRKQRRECLAVPDRDLGCAVELKWFRNEDTLRQLQPLGFDLFACS
jgi:hypothetical protein